jgi:hypothetical protein
MTGLWELDEEGNKGLGTQRQTPSQQNGPLYSFILFGNAWDTMYKILFQENL